MTTMRAAVYHGAKEVVTETANLASLPAESARLKVAYAGICGTDMMIYAGLHPRAQAPLIMGHEFSGVIADLQGDGNFAVGDRVVVEPTLSCGRCAACRAGERHVCRSLRLIGIDSNGGFAEYADVPLHRLHRVPDGLSNAHAALGEPVAVAVHSVRRAGLKGGERILILGAGPIGLLIGMVAKLSGAREVMIADIRTHRLRVAQHLGFVTLNAESVDVVETVRERTGGEGADVVFEAAGTAGTARQMTDCVRTQGLVVVVSVYKQAPPVDLAGMHFRELSLTTTRCYSRDDFATALAWMAEQRIDVRPIISHRIGLENAGEGFRMMENPEGSLKILIHTEEEKA